MRVVSLFSIVFLTILCSLNIDKRVILVRSDVNSLKINKKLQECVNSKLARSS